MRRSRPTGVAEPSKKKIPEEVRENLRSNFKKFIYLFFVTQLTTLILVRRVEFMCRLFLVRLRVLFCWVSWLYTLVTQSGGTLDLYCDSSDMYSV
jgi:hypothetical protein